jgi:hypothetical protein
MFDSKNSLKDLENSVSIYIINIYKLVNVVVYNENSYETIIINYQILLNNRK